MCVCAICDNVLLSNQNIYGVDEIDVGKIVNKKENKMNCGTKSILLWENFICINGVTCFNNIKNEKK